MPDPAFTIRHTLVLRRVDPERGMARFYALMIERDLFGTIRLVRTRGRELADVFETEQAALPFMEREAERDKAKP